MALHAPPPSRRHWSVGDCAAVDNRRPHALGLSLDQAIATFGKVGGILSATNYGIYRQRHANTAAAPRAAAPRGAPATP